MAKSARKWILIPEYRPLFAMQECFGPQHGPLREPCPTPIPIIGKLLRQIGDNKLTIYEVKMNPDRTTTAPVLLTLDNYTLPYDEITGGKKVEPGPSLESTQKEPEAVHPVIGNLSSTPKEPEPEKAPESVPVKIGTSIVDDNPEPDEEVADQTDDVPVEEVQEQEAETDEVPEQPEVENDAEAEEMADGGNAQPELAKDETPESATVETEQDELPPEPEVTVTAADGVEVEGISPKVKPYAQMSKKERREARRREAEAADKAE